MNYTWPVIDTHLAIGVNPMNHFIAEDELISLLIKNGVDLQIIFQHDEGFHHETPLWNPYSGNDYIAKIQKMFPNQVLGLATVDFWLRTPLQAKSMHTQQLTRNVALEELERVIVDLKLHGVRIHPMLHNYRINDDHLVFPALDHLCKLQSQVNRQLIVHVYSGGDHINNTDDAIAETAARYPELLFICNHAGFIWNYGHIGTVLAKLNNVLLDLTSMPQFSIIQNAYDIFGPHKFCAGTAGPWGGVELKNTFVEELCNENIEEISLILGGNIAKYLNIPQRKRV
jgi:predicted TIM-barrel fold metal-dependent hydrolase